MIFSTFFKCVFLASILQQVLFHRLCVLTFMNQVMRQKKKKTSEREDHREKKRQVKTNFKRNSVRGKNGPVGRGESKGQKHYKSEAEH